MSVPVHTPDQIAGIVREVLRRIAGEQPRPTAAPAAAAASAPRPTAASPTASPAVTLPEKVVTGATLAALPSGTLSVTLRADAVVTPTARDAARRSGIVLVRGGPDGAGGTSGAGRPIFVATADGGVDAPQRAAALVSALRGAQQLPATGLADVVAALSLHLPRDGGRGVLLAGRPHVATALANRSPGIRAVTARDVATLLAAVKECAANLVVVHPRDVSAVGLARVGITLAGAPDSVPVELAAACPCRGGTNPPPDAPCGCHHPATR